MNSRLPAYFQINNFGISSEDVVKCTLHCTSNDIHHKVILTPAWGSEVFTEVAEDINETGPGIWQVKYAGQFFSLIQSGIGAPMAGEAVLALGCTPCETMVFTGSLAGLDSHIEIGDLFLVERSICGDGFSRYLNPSLVPDDCFLQPVEPDHALKDHIYERASEICRRNSIPLHRGTVYSMDCVLPEFFRLNHFIGKLGCTGLEMETAAVFRAAKLVQIKTSALLIVSDNPLQMKSLYSGRTEADHNRRRTVRRRVLAKAILDSLV